MKPLHSRIIFIHPLFNAILVFKIKWFYFSREELTKTILYFFSVYIFKFRANPQGLSLTCKLSLD
ncbi:hypothetical protein CF122_19200 [Aeromonas media]|nr:hypothetical protein CF122_19200 [Aeromonas media]